VIPSPTENVAREPALRYTSFGCDVIAGRTLIHTLLLFSAEPHRAVTRTQYRAVGPATKARDAAVPFDSGVLVVQQAPMCRRAPPRVKCS
jgi:hypothetical protein